MIFQGGGVQGSTVTPPTQSAVVSSYHYPAGVDHHHNNNNNSMMLTDISYPSPHHPMAAHPHGLAASTASTGSGSVGGETATSTTPIQNGTSHHSTDNILDKQVSFLPFPFLWKHRMKTETNPSTMQGAQKQTSSRRSRKRLFLQY